VREADETGVAWQTRQRDFGPIKMSYDLEKANWVIANKKYLTVIKNTIKHVLVGSIPDYDIITECLKQIKNQFTDSSKTYTTHLVKQLGSLVT
jgi:hypothetical protein